jgi:hypothetical protein
MSEQEESFMYFMFWALRTKLADRQGTVGWDEFFMYTAAMGYNDLTQAQINWFVTGNPDGDIGDVDFKDISFDSTAVNERARVGSLTFKDQVKRDIVHRALVHNTEPTTIPPNKSVSPSAGPTSGPKRYRLVDGKLREVIGDTGTLEETERRTISGIPSKVSNIPDPRYSERGGKQVKNIRIITVRNPDYKPDLPDGPDNKQFLHKGTDKNGNKEDPFIEEEVPDIGAGAKEVQRDIERAEADRLHAALPFKLYAPIHAQACDRYLGVKNYSRLALDAEAYFKSYSQHPFGPKDYQQQYNWNSLVLRVYGPMLYAFVTDVEMQRTTPIFTMETPESVVLEYMELNELIDELKSYQMKSTDRANRVGDSGVGQTPIEKHLDDFFRDRDRTEQEKLDDANAVIISLPDLPPIAPRPGDNSGQDDGGDIPDNPPAPNVDPGKEVADDLPVSMTFGIQSNKPPTSVTASAEDISHGIRRQTHNERSLRYNQEHQVYEALNDKREKEKDLDNRSRMYKMFRR